MNVSDPEWLLIEVKLLTAPCASGQVPGGIPAAPCGWFQPHSGPAGGARGECWGEVAQAPGVLDSGLHRPPRQPKEPPSDCCARQRRPGSLAGAAVLSPAAAWGRAVGTAGARRGALPPVPPWNHPHLCTSLVHRLETIFSQARAFFLSDRTASCAGYKTLLCLLRVTVTFPSFTTCPLPKNGATET